MNLEQAERVRRPGGGHHPTRETFLATHKHGLNRTPDTLQSRDWSAVQRRLGSKQSQGTRRGRHWKVCCREAPHLIHRCRSPAIVYFGCGVLRTGQFSHTEQFHVVEIFPLLSRRLEPKGLAETPSMFKLQVSDVPGDCRRAWPVAGRARHSRDSSARWTESTHSPSLRTYRPFVDPSRCPQRPRILRVILHPRFRRHSIPTCRLDS